MLIETLGDVVSNAVSRAQQSAGLALNDADAIAKMYGEALLADRPRLLALTQAADMATLHASAAAARAAHIGAQTLTDSSGQIVKVLAEEALRHARDAENLLAAATY